MYTIDEFQPQAWLERNTQTQGLDCESLAHVLWFTLIWNRFEYHVCGQQSGIMQRIDDSLHQADSENSLQWKDFEECWNRIRKFSRTKPAMADLPYFLLKVDECSPKVKKRMQRLKDLLAEQQPDLCSAIKGMLFIAYRVRNNLYHGSKSVSSLHGQIELFNVLYALLARYIDIISQKSK